MNMKWKWAWAISLTLFLLPAAGSAANRYVRAGATGSGDGSDWNNAYTNIPGTLVRGDTYFVAAGNYGTVRLSTPESGTSYIYIRKATESDHGTDVGWAPSYGTGQAMFTGPVQFVTSYWDWDGVVGSGPGTVPYGFKISFAGTCSGSTRKLVEMGYGSHIRFKHTDVQHCGYSYSGGQDCVFIGSGPSTTTTDIYIGYNWMHNVNRVHIYGFYATNVVIEHNWFTERLNDNSFGVHGESFSMYGNKSNMGHVYRYNHFRNVEGTGIIVIQDSGSGGYDIYGNVFYTDPAHIMDGYVNGPTPTVSMFSTTNGALADTGAFANSNVNIYNNTFVDLYGKTGQGINNPGSSNVTVRNNLWVNCGYPALIGTTVSNNTIRGASSLFVDYAGRDFRLKVPTGQGNELPAPYNRDMLGSVRGTDGVWDHGAFENGSATGAPNPPVSKIPMAPADIEVTP